MPDIYHTLSIAGSKERIFEAIGTGEGLNSWWTLTARGVPRSGAIYDFGFGPDYQWQAEVIRCEPGVVLEWKMTQSAPDWMGTCVGFQLKAVGDATQVDFHHTGWLERSDHYRVSSFCWGMYLRLLRRYIERGEVVPYDKRSQA